MTHCDICHSRIYTYIKFKVGLKTVCYHCKIKDLEKKLGAVKTELGRVQTSLSLLGRRYNISVARFHELVTNLWTAIGQKDPRVPCEKCPDMCIAYTDVHGKCPHEKEAEE